jgi:prevent-host-death family protein
MEVSTTKFKENCLELIDEVYTSHTEIVITKHGEALAKLVSIQNKTSKPFVGSLTGVGETVGDLCESFEDEWELD